VTWDAVHLLAEPTRRRVYDAVRAARGPLTRDEAAAAAGITARLAAFHLDQLAGAGLLAVDYARPPGRGGPGAGRPAKRYAAAGADVAVSVPPRRYDVAARILALGVRDASGGDPAAATLDAAEGEGRRIGLLRRSARRLSRRATVERAGEALADLGYEPVAEAGGLRLANCPFHAVVDVSPRLVCGMNERFVRGLLDGLNGSPAICASLEPAPPDCCVRVRQAGSTPTSR
jgi:predicted ArsR family transcriptional regulator